MAMHKCILAIIVVTGMALAQDYANDVVALRAILDSNKITGVTIENIATSESGRIVRLNLTNTDPVKNYISRLPSQIGQLTALQYLALKDNQLPSLPEEIGNLTQLKEIELTGNELSSLPSSFAKLTELEKVLFESNEFGAFPPELLGMKKLSYVQLRNNRLTTLPESIGGMSSLKELYLGNNRLTSLPRGITRLALGYFEMMGNKLCSLPADLDAWLKKREKRYKEYQKCL